jgi:hypothetical protein
VYCSELCRSLFRLILREVFHRHDCLIASKMKLWAVISDRTVFSVS